MQHHVECTVTGSFQGLMCLNMDCFIISDTVAKTKFPSNLMMKRGVEEANE